jgi:hypothetical protein
MSKSESMNGARSMWREALARVDRPAVTREAIAMRAYLKSLQHAGAPCAVRDWVEAEQELRAEASGS